MRVFIVGADRGIGSSLTRCFLEGGHRVFAGQYMPEWPELSGMKEEFGETLSIVPMDAGSTASVFGAASLTAEQTDALDMVVMVAGIGGRDDLDGKRACYNVNCVGAMRVTEAFLPLLEKGEGKRLCYFSSESGCISLLHRTEGATYPSSKTILDMTVHLMFNELRPKGYTFRLYHPGWVNGYMGGTKGTGGNFEPEESAREAYVLFTTDTEYEDVFVKVDISHELWPVG